MARGISLESLEDVVVDIEEAITDERLSPQ
jgi:hypothetical protein